MPEVHFAAKNNAVRVLSFGKEGFKVSNMHQFTLRVTATEVSVARKGVMNRETRFALEAYDEESDREALLGWMKQFERQSATQKLCVCWFAALPIDAEELLDGLGLLQGSFVFFGKAQLAVFLLPDESMLQPLLETNVDGLEVQTSEPTGERRFHFPPEQVVTECPAVRVSDGPRRRERVSLRWVPNDTGGHLEIDGLELAFLSKTEQEQSNHQDFLDWLGGRTEEYVPMVFILPKALAFVALESEFGRLIGGSYQAEREVYLLFLLRKGRAGIFDFRFRDGGVWSKLAGKAVSHSARRTYPYLVDRYGSIQEARRIEDKRFVSLRVATSGSAAGWL